MARDKIKTRPLEIAHLTEQIHHSTWLLKKVFSYILQSRKQHVMGIHNAYVPAYFLPLIHPGFALWNFSTLCPHPVRSDCRSTHLSAVEAVTTMDQYRRVPDRHEWYAAGPAQGGDIDAFQFLSPTGLWAQNEPETTASWRGWAQLTNGILPALKVASLGFCSVYTYVLNF